MHIAHDLFTEAWYAADIPPVKLLAKTEMKA